MASSQETPVRGAGWGSEGKGRRSLKKFHRRALTVKNCQRIFSQGRRLHFEPVKRHQVTRDRIGATH